MVNIPSSSSSPVKSVRARDKAGADRDWSNVAVISSSDIQKWKTLCVSKEEIALRQQQEQEARRSASKERAASWSNTIDALRIQGDRRRQQRFEEEEKRRKIIDAEEAQLREEQRRSTLVNAEYQLLQRNDKVKAFHSKLLTYHTIVERDAQLQVRRELDEMHRKRDEYFADLERRNIAASAIADDVRRSQSVTIAKQTKSEQVRQLEELKLQRLAQRAEAEAEKRRLREAALAEEAKKASEVEAARIQRRELARQLRVQNEKVIEERNRLKAMETRKEHRSDSTVEREGFAIHKSVRQQLLEERQQHRFIAKLKRIQHTTENLQSIVDAKEERDQHLEQQRRAEGVLGMSEAITSRDHERTSRAKEQAKTTDLEFQNRLEQRRRLGQLREERQEKLREEAIAVHQQQLLEEEMAEREERKRELRELQRIQLLQKKEKEMQRIQERLNEIEEGKSFARASRLMEEEANRYVAQTVQEFSPSSRYPKTNLESPVRAGQFRSKSVSPSLSSQREGSYGASEEERSPSVDRAYDFLNRKAFLAC